MNKEATPNDLQDLVIEADSGARRPGGITAYVMFALALCWSLYQLWIASPIPSSDFFINNTPQWLRQALIFNSSQARIYHLFFAVALAFLAYPAFKKSPRRYVPWNDWLFAILASVSILYLLYVREALAGRMGNPNQYDLIYSAIGVVLLLEAARRALGPPLVIIAVIFLIYTFAGPYMPEIIAHKGQSVNKVASHQWLTTEGVFGVAIGVSTDFVFLFVLFGALLEKAGAGNYFIKLAFSLLGHFRGGPAKAAVLSSAMTGVISGSSIANVVTTGTFTVPLMRKVGFSREKAGAVEVASSVNGQIMPPVMGAAAFLMVEYVGITYVEVVKHAFIPAVISYIALLYLVHLEALKSNMQSIPKAKTNPLSYSLIMFGITVSSMIILAAGVYYGIGWIKVFAGDDSLMVIMGLVLLSYIALLFFASRYPPLEVDNPNSKIVTLPEVGPTLKTGLHYILPIVVLVWCLMIERLSPGLSAFWATAFMVFIIVTQKPMLSLFREKQVIGKEWFAGIVDLIDGMITGARNMTGIGIATAAAGIIVGSVSLTGIGQVMTELVETISGGSFVLVLIFTALICLILGMGLPTTANYIVVSSLMATVLVQLGKQNGLEIPLIAIHLFVFYFGIMADVTPPVGLASFAAAAVSGGDPIKTGVQAFVYSIRTVILPFIFIYNPELLLIGVDSIWHAAWVFFKATFAILVFAAAMQGFFLVRNRLFDTVILLLVAFALFRPGFFIDVITPSYKEASIVNLTQVVEEAEIGQKLKFKVNGVNDIGEPKTFYVFMDVPKGETGQARLEEFGVVLTIDTKKQRAIIDDVVFNSKAENAGLDFDFEIIEAWTPMEQMHRIWIYISAIILFLVVVVLQVQRKQDQRFTSVAKEKRQLEG